MPTQHAILDDLRLDADHVAVVLAGAASVDAFRRDNPDTRLELATADLSRADLNGVDLHGADLRQTDLSNAKLAGANLRSTDCAFANLSHACLVNAHLENSDLSACTLTEANMTGVHLNNANLQNARANDAFCAHGDLQNTDLGGADLNGACLKSANLIGARLRETNLAGADVTGVEFIKGGFTLRRRSVTNCRGVCLDGCHGHAGFKRYVEDQDWIEEFRQQSPMNYVLCLIWALLTDCGRSLSRVTLVGLTLAYLFGRLYADCSQHLNLEGSANTEFTPYYYSIVTLTTLGFGDVLPATVLGELMVVLEVILGYILLGLLVSILANKVARRS